MVVAVFQNAFISEDGKGGRSEGQVDPHDPN